MTEKERRINHVENCAEINNAMMDFQKSNSEREISWLENNYDDCEMLKSHFLEKIKQSDNRLYSVYADDLRNYSLDDLQILADFRIGVLKETIRESERNKVDTSRLKVFADMLKDCR